MTLRTSIPAHRARPEVPAGVSRSLRPPLEISWRAAMTEVVQRRGTGGLPVRERCHPGCDMPEHPWPLWGRGNCLLGDPWRIITSNVVETLLRSEGPCLSSDPAQKLEARGLSLAAARQRVSRGGPRVRRLSGLTFPKRARFVYHEGDFGSDRYWSALVRDVSRASPAYGPALAAVVARGSAVPLPTSTSSAGRPCARRVRCRAPPSWSA